MSGYYHESPSFDRSDGCSRKLILGIFSHVDIASQLCPATLVDNIRSDFGTADESGVLLTWTDQSAVSYNSGIKQ